MRPHKPISIYFDGDIYYLIYFTRILWIRIIIINVLLTVSKFDRSLEINMINRVLNAPNVLLLFVLPRDRMHWECPIMRQIISSIEKILHWYAPKCSAFVCFYFSRFVSNCGQMLSLKSMRSSCKFFFAEHNATFLSVVYKQKQKQRLT